MNRPAVDVAAATDNGVVCIENHVEVVAVDVIEATTVRAEPALRHERAQKKRFLLLAAEDPILVCAVHAREQNAVAGSNLVEPLPEQQRHADHVDEAKHRVVVRTGELVPLPRAEPQRRMLAGVEELGGVYGTPEPV